MTRILFVLFLTIICLIAGCATKPIEAPAETVGTLAPSYHSIAVKPVHTSTDLTPKEFIGADEDTKETPRSVEVMEPDSVPKSAHGF